MIAINDSVINAITTPVRKIEARVELFDSSTLVNIFKHNGELISFTVDRVGEDSKFFGFGVSQKINIKLIDIKRELNITTDNYFRVIYTIGEEDIAPYPNFYVTEVHRNENTNELSITGYDALYTASAHKADELALFHTPEDEVEVIEDATEIKIENYINSCADVLGLTEAITTSASGEWQNISYTNTTEVNLEGTETIKDVLDDIAEVAGAIYYINSNNALTFVRLGGSVLPIDKAQYIALDSGENRRLSIITHSTELGDNITVSTGSIGSTQYIRSNCFIELNVDNTTLVLNDLITDLADFTINQFECSWRGNPALEIGDRIDLTTKNNAIVSSYVINDTIEYNGALTQKTSWSYEDNAEDTEDNPSTLGEALKQTFAKVDKANKQITILTSATSDNEADIAQLKIDTESIVANVSSTQTTIEELSGDISTLQEEVTTKITPEALEIAITEALSNGVDSVSTTTGFTFNSDGLNITKTDSEISTKINEDGMRVSKENEEVLTADNTGVNAINLTARKYLIIGTKSRFEDYGNRTGCFWIGG